MFASPSFNFVRAVWMLLKEDKALKVWPISICVRGIVEELKHPPSVYSKLRVTSGRTHMSRMQLTYFFPKHQSLFTWKHSLVLKLKQLLHSDLFFLMHFNDVAVNGITVQNQEILKCCFENSVFRCFPQRGSCWAPLSKGTYLLMSS